MMKKISVAIIIIANIASFTLAMEQGNLAIKQQDNSDSKILQRTFDIFTITSASIPQSSDTSNKNNLVIRPQDITYAGIIRTIKEQRISSLSNLETAFENIKKKNNADIKNDVRPHLESAATDFNIIVTLRKLDIHNIKDALQFLRDKYNGRQLASKEEVKTFLDTKYSQIIKIYPIKSLNIDGYNFQPLSEGLRKENLCSLPYIIAKASLLKLDNNWDTAFGVSLYLLAAATRDFSNNIDGHTSPEQQTAAQLNEKIVQRTGCYLS